MDPNFDNFNISACPPFSRKRPTVSTLVYINDIFIDYLLEEVRVM
jgi:hypothetical protein